MTLFSFLSCFFQLFLLFFFFCCFPYQYSLGKPIAVDFLYPNYNASYFFLIDNSGVFLSSSAGVDGVVAFSAALQNPYRQQSSCYLTLLHAPSGTVVWTANPANPIPPTADLSLTPAGLSLALTNGSLAWSTPPLPRPVAALRLLASGELLLVDAVNTSLWSSFDHPTDTLLPNQLLNATSVGAAAPTVLTSATSDTDPTPGDYQLVVISGDAVLKWTTSSQIYWALSTDVPATNNSNFEVAYMAINATGLYLLAADKKTAVFERILPPQSSPDEFRFAKLDYSGQLRILRYSPNNFLSSSTFGTDFVAPVDNCDLPMACGSLGLCSSIGNGSTCGCPDLFGQSSTSGCLPIDGEILTNSSCRSRAGLSTASYVSLGRTVDYFWNKFATPTASGDDWSACRSLCSGNCSCLGFFYKNSSKSCYLLEHQIGSLSSSDSATTATGYIKILNSQANKNNSSTSSANLVVKLLPAIASILLIMVVSFIGFRLSRKKKNKDGKCYDNFGSSGQMMHGPNKYRPTSMESAGEESEMDEDNILIPGLPTRFTYADLEAATNNFLTQIGSGGFGTVYKGQLPDKSLVAVKKINNIGVQGKREFCTEIAIIGNIHHVNLVKLRGYCAQGRKRLLVYEYMNRGSLDRSLFGPGPTLEWPERVAIAVGAARGLAYLHSGCEHKIIHCDVKPENILLHEHNQVKIADFGLAKLITPEQSELFTTMRGTRGYLAPEWLTNSAISDKTDVYSFGMVLLEIVRGRRNRSNDYEPIWIGSSSSSGSIGPVFYFPMVALEMHGMGRYEELADPRLEGRVAGPEIAKVVKVALCCLHEEPMLRPSMAALAAMLEGTMPVPEPMVESLNSLRFNGRRFNYPKATKGLSGDFTNSGSASSTSFVGKSLPSTMPSYMSAQQLSGAR